MEKINTGSDVSSGTKKSPERTNIRNQSVAKYERLVLSLENQIREINESKKADTGVIAWVGDWVGEKTGAYATGKEAYAGVVSNLATSAKEFHAKMRAEIGDGANLSDAEKTRAEELLSRLEKVSGAKLEGVSWADAVTNAVGGRNSEIVRNVMKYSGLRTGISAAEGAYEGVAGIAEITGKAIAMLAAIPDPEVRAVVAEDLENVLSNLTVANAKKVLDAIPKALEEFKKLPIDKQMEGAAKFGGMVLVPLGIGMKGVQAGKAVAEVGIATAKAGTETAARAARIMAKQAGRASGASERALKVAGKAATAGVAALSIGTAEVAVAGTAVAAGTAVRYVGEMGAGQKKAVAGAMETATKDAALAEKMAKAEAKSGMSPETVLKNAALPDSERLVLAGNLLGVELSEAQKTVILRLHNDVSKGIYQNGHKELRAMVEELDKAGFSRTEGRKLMENGVLGFESMWLRRPEHMHSPERILLTKEEFAAMNLRNMRSEALLVRESMNEFRSGILAEYDNVMSGTWNQIREFFYWKCELHEIRITASDGVYKLNEYESRALQGLKTRFDFLIWEQGESEVHAVIESLR